VIGVSLLRLPYKISKSLTVWHPLVHHGKYKRPRFSGQQVACSLLVGLYITNARSMIRNMYRTLIPEFVVSFGRSFLRHVVGDN